MCLRGFRKITSIFRHCERDAFSPEAISAVVGRLLRRQKRQLAMTDVSHLKAGKYPSKQNQHSAGSEAHNLSNKSLTISNPFEDIIPSVVKLDKGIKMTSGFVTLIIFLFALGGMILIHEFGHFIAARWAGIEVEEFGIGLPSYKIATLFKWKGTEFTIHALLLGGFIRPKGENDPTVPGGLA
jgi:hypothetical protein